MLKKNPQGNPQKNPQGRAKKHPQDRATRKSTDRTEQKSTDKTEGKSTHRTEGVKECLFYSGPVDTQVAPPRTLETTPSPLHHRVRTEDQPISGEVETFWQFNPRGVCVGAYMPANIHNGIHFSTYHRVRTGETAQFSAKPHRQSAVSWGSRRPMENITSVYRGYR